MSIIGIVAVDRNGAIGKGGTLPWHYSADLKFFKQTTMGHACVMGRNTWNALKKPLPGRLNIVLSHQLNLEPQESVMVMRDLESVLTLAREVKNDLFVIGGAKVYRAFLPYINEWIVTEVPLSVQGADTFVPANYLEGFSCVGSKQLDENLVVRFYSRLPE